MKEVVIPGHSFNVVMNGSRVCYCRSSAANLNIFHLRLIDLYRDFGDEFADLIWRAYLGLAKRAISASPDCTLLKIEVIRCGSCSCGWR